MANIYICKKNRTEQILCNNRKQKCENTIQKDLFNYINCNKIFFEIFVLDMSNALREAFVYFFCADFIFSDTPLPCVSAQKYKQSKTDRQRYLLFVPKILQCRLAKFTLHLINIKTVHSKRNILRSIYMMIISSNSSPL